MTVEAVTLPDERDQYLQWTPVIAGAIAATALSFILVTFAVAVGLGVSSTSPTWRDASAALAILSGIYLILQAIVSFGLGVSSRAAREDLSAQSKLKKWKAAMAFMAWRRGLWPFSWEPR
jgi:hypothetical protein